MMQRFITGFCLVLVLIAALWIGGLGFSIPFMIMLCMAIYEMNKAMATAGHRPVEWPCWVCVALSIPLYHFVGSVALLMPLIGGAYMLIAAMVIFRDEPKLEDILMSALPLVCILLPGMCMLGLQKAPDRASQLLLTILAFGVPLMGDTMAYFIGSRFGVRKLCPAVSPNKSIEGAVAGLVGSILFAMAAAGVCSIFAQIPPFWHFPILGLLGGIAGQVGDLFASLVKRHCGVKDFSNIFPGHGGVMDRLDSVYWATVVMYIYLNISLSVLPAG